MLEFHPQFRLDGRRARTWLNATDQVQPVIVRFVQIGIALDERFRVQRQKEIGRMVAQSVAKKTGRTDSHDRKWLIIQIEDAADDGRIRRVLLAP